MGKLTVPQIVGVLDDILGALVAAEAKGVIHRDLKPENLLRTADGEIKVADFGIAKASEESGIGPGLTLEGRFMGTPLYVAPEVVRGEAATTASDLYAVGVIAYELVTGSAPFSDSMNEQEVLVRKIEQKAPSLRKTGQVPESLAKWTDQLLLREVTQRGRSAAGARDALRAAAAAALGEHWRNGAQLPVEEPHPAPPTPSVNPRSRFAGLGTLATYGTPLPKLLLRAATRPLNLAIGGVLIVASIFREPWLAAVGVTAYAALVALTFFDENEAATTRPH